MLDLRNLKVVDEKWWDICTLNQRQTAERLEITERYLRDLDKYYPPRTRRGRGVESRYKWPAVLFWWFEFQIARAEAKSDDWAFQQWCDKQYCMRRIAMAEQELEDFATALEKAGVSPTYVMSARHIFRN